MGIAAGIGAAAAAASAGSAIANSGGGSSPAPAPSVPGATPNLGTGLADLYGFFAPIGNELSGLGVPQTAYQPVTGLNFNTPGFNFGLNDTNGTLSGGITQNSPFEASLPGISASFGDIASGAKAASENFLKNVLGTDVGGTNPILAPLRDIEFARQKATSDIEGSLAERGVNGSSFSTNALANADATFGQASADAALKLSEGIFRNQLESLNTEGQNIQRRADLANAELAREIHELNLETGAGESIQNSITANSSRLAQLAAAAAAGRAHALANAGFNLGPLLQSTFGSLPGGIAAGANELATLGADIFGGSDNSTNFSADQTAQAPADAVVPGDFSQSDQSTADNFNADTGGSG